MCYHVPQAGAVDYGEYMADVLGYGLRYGNGLGYGLGHGLRYWFTV